MTPNEKDLFRTWWDGWRTSHREMTANNAIEAFEAILPETQDLPEQELQEQLR